jgi:hypothetical protein
MTQATDDIAGADTALQRFGRMMSTDGCLLT